MKLWKKIFLGLIVLLLLIQLFRIDKTNPETLPENEFVVTEQAPEAVVTILKKACYDCHSNYTTYPWYSNVAPISWFLADHIKEGRGELNLSEWAGYSAKKKAHKMDECGDEIREQEMPLKAYVIWHPEAELNPEEIQTLSDFFAEVEGRYAPTK